MLKICECCGEEFAAQRITRRRCDACYRLHRQDKSKADRKRMAEKGIDLTRAVPISKQCYKCGEIKPASEFFKAKDRPDGLQSRCRQCGAQLVRELNAKKPKPDSPIKLCPICEKSVSGKLVFCSDECRKEIARRKAQIYAASKKVLIERECRECGQKFIAEYGNGHRVFCSKRCLRKHARRIEKATRRARIEECERIENIDPLSILKHDEYRCYICGVRTPKNLRGTTEQNAPEMDHVVPISRGGSHTNDNVRCICRRCNIEKSNRLIDEYMPCAVAQPMLLGV